MEKKEKSKKTPVTPTSLVNLLAIMLKTFLANWWKRLLLAAIIGIGGFVLHTFLLVGPNEGFLKNRLPLSEYFLNFAPSMTKNIPGMTLFTGKLIWFIASFSLAGLLFQLVDQKLRFFYLRYQYIKNTFLRITRVPAYVTVLLVGILLALALTLFVPNPLFFIVLAAAILIGISAEEYCNFFLVAKLTHDDFCRVLRRTPKPFDYVPVSGFMTGTAIGFLLNGILQPKSYGTVAQYVTLGVFAILFILKVTGVFSGKKIGKAMLFILFFLGFLPFLHTVAYAHDGGWKEAGATWSKWWNSLGRDTALNLGFWRGGWSVGGALAGATFHVFSNIDLYSDRIIAEMDRLSAFNKSPLGKAARAIGVVGLVDNGFSLIDIATDNMIAGKSFDETIRDWIMQGGYCFIDGVLGSIGGPIFTIGTEIFGESTGLNPKNLIESWARAMKKS